MNVVILRGNLTRDPESREVQYSGGSTTVTNFTLAVNRHFKKSDGSKDKETTYVDCEAWDTGAAAIAKYIKKGDALLIRGCLKLDRWEVDGQKRNKLRVRVNEFEFLPRGRSQNDEPSDISNETQQQQEVTDPAAVGDDIPF